MTAELSCYNKMPQERNNSFNEYCKIRDLPPHQRNLRKVAENNIKQKNITKNHQKYSSELKKEYDRLKKLSQKWQWQKRFELYDLDQQVELMKKRDDTFYSMNKALLDIIEGFIKYVNNLLAELVGGNAHKKNGDEFSLGTKIKMLNEITSIIRNANDLLCQLCGRPSEYSKLELDGSLGVNATVTDDETEEEKLERYANYFKQINSKATSIPNKDNTRE